MKVKGISLGCKVNTYEIEYILSSFKDHGYDIVDDAADIYVINTCSVTNMSDAKSRKVINRVIRENPKAIIVVMGCMIEANKDYDNNGISIIIGNKDKNRIVELVEDYIKTKEKKKLLYKDFDSTFEDMFIKNMYGRTRAFVKIQDGCENYCAYCVIPFVRGRCRSKDKDKVIKEITSLVNNGYKEIVLTGIHTGQYNSDGKRLSVLINRLSEIEGLERIRLSSVEIVELDDGMMDIIKNNNKFVSHLHIPLQAGSNHILKEMNRRYDRDYFLEMVDKIKSLRPGISLSTDVIVGFPGETEEDFNDTLDLCRKIGFSKIHVFPYSDRNGTVASRMKDKIPGNIKKDRVHRLINLSNELEKEYFNKCIGSEVEVLIEEEKDGFYYGFTSNYIPLKLQGNYKINDIYKIKLEKKDINFDMN
jgi:threonylcarbamoyladenosine tRNA methylthiotransferase MtaB